MFMTYDATAIDDQKRYSPRSIWKKMLYSVYGRGGGSSSLSDMVTLHICNLLDYDLY